MMATQWYGAVFEPSADGFSVYFPDLPGCTSAGHDFAEAARNAAEALTGHTMVSWEHGEALPAPGSGGAVKLGRHDRLALIPIELPSRVERVTMSMEQSLLHQADRLAADYGTTRSGLFAMLVRNELQTRAAPSARQPQVARRAAARTRVRKVRTG